MSGFANPPRYAAETAQAYVASLLAVLGDRDPLEVMAATPAALREATAGLDAAAARAPEAEGKWSVQEVVRHLADSEIVYGYRIRLIVAAERPAIPGYDQDAWAQRLGYLDGPLDEALADHAAMRAMNLRWLRARTPAELARTGLHSERGEESVAHIARLLAAHDLVHLRQIARIRGATGA
jgi:hypothetical protein